MSRQGTLSSATVTGTDPVTEHWHRHCRDLGLEPIPTRRTDLISCDAGVLYRDDGRRELLIGTGLDHAPEQAICWVLAHEAGHHALHRSPSRLVQRVEELQARHERTTLALLILATVLAANPVVTCVLLAAAAATIVWPLLLALQQRRHEFQADAYAARLGALPDDPEALRWLDGETRHHALDDSAPAAQPDWITRIATPNWPLRRFHATRHASVRGACTTLHSPTAKAGELR